MTSRLSPRVSSVLSADVRVGTEMCGVLPSLRARQQTDQLMPKKFADDVGHEQAPPSPPPARPGAALHVPQWRVQHRWLEEGTEVQESSGKKILPDLPSEKQECEVRKC